MADGGGLGSLPKHGGFTIELPAGGKRLQCEHPKQGCLFAEGGEARGGRLEVGDAG